ncbi:hypothetical protein Taro_006317 [Colocasia esculenta]|uniref:non-specific serine/threonine protein kinase n=1 Tax=Colocasia esculenta TaxID=4460 RepID=A0A843TWN6_COLES|nr:hypothetical protein [Colocasia esculenta]
MFRFSSILKVLLTCFFLPSDMVASEDDKFTFNGFQGSKLSLDGTAVITPAGLLRLTNTTKLLSGHAFYPSPFRFKRSQTSRVLSFSSTFVFGIVSEEIKISGQGVLFVISPSRDLRGAQVSQYMGLFNSSNNGNSTNHILAVELDTIQNPDFEDINANHVGIDINSLISNESTSAGYFVGGTGEFRNLSLVSGDPMQVWVEYDGRSMHLNVTLAPIRSPKPGRPLLSSAIDLSDVFEELMYVGFSSSSDPFVASHYVLGWSFSMNGDAPALDLRSLPLLPRRSGEQARKRLEIWVSFTATLLVLLAIGAAVVMVRRRAKFAELLEEWELEYGPSRLPYRELYEATKGFSDKELLGAGGFGAVYKGVLPSSKLEVAVKRLSHGSRQGIREFVAEVASIGRLRHRNLVQLQGYCRLRKGELLLVYDFMPNGSLDKLLFDQTRCRVGWGQRLRIIRGVASALQYLHEEWEQVVIHRDVKAGNVLLDCELNARLGDFGLARLYDHGTDSQTTHVVGTMGYLAPELMKRRRATKATDVFAFGVFLLEVACGRRPVEPHLTDERTVLVEWVVENWKRGTILAVADPRLRELGFAAEEVDLVLKLGLLCCDPLPAVRPSMRRVMQFLDGDAPLPEFESTYLNSAALALLRNEALDVAMDDFCSMSYLSVAESSLSGGI